MNNNLLTKLIARSIIFAFPVVCHANSIFTNFGSGLAYDINEGNPVGNAFDGNLYAEGDTFTPSANSQFGSLTIALSCLYTGGCPDAFTVSLASNSGGQPGAALESFLVPGASLGVLGVYNSPVILQSLLSPLLTSGTPYWVTVASDFNDSIAWNLNVTGDLSDQAISADGGATWFSPSGLTPGAYQVDTTPEPGAAVLFISALTLFYFFAKRRTRNT